MRQERRNVFPANIPVLFIFGEERRPVSLSDIKNHHFAGIDSQVVILQINFAIDISREWRLDMNVCGEATFWIDSLTLAADRQ